jgi:hypothetical protein
MERELQWLSRAPQNGLFCCNSPIWLPTHTGPINKEEVALFIEATLDPRHSRLLPPSELSRASDLVIEVERKLEGNGETIRQARYFVLTYPTTKNGKSTVDYVEVHARDVYRGRNPTSVKAEKTRSGLPSILTIQRPPDWRCCETHQPESGRLSRAVTLFRTGFERYTTEVTGKWLKSGEGDDWGTLVPGWPE